MTNFLRKLIANGFVKGEQRILDLQDLNRLVEIVNKLRSQQLKRDDKLPFLQLAGANEELDLFLEKILSNEYVKENLKTIVGENYLMMSPCARFSSPGDKGLELHQDAIGETGLLFLLSSQKKGSTVMLKSSHKFPGRISNYLSWNSNKLINLISLISDNVTGEKGEHYYWFHKTWHGRKSNADNVEEHISIFFPFFPQEANRTDVAEENAPYIKKTENQYLKSLMTEKKQANDLKPNIETPICMKIEKFNFKDILNINFHIFLLKLLFLEFLFFPIRVLRIFKKLRFNSK